MQQDNSAQPIISLEDFYIRADKSDGHVTNQVAWNWSVAPGERLAVMTSNSYLRYQLMGVLSGLVPAVAGRQVRRGVIGWPLGGEGGLDSKLKVSQNVHFVSQLYQDRLDPEHVSLDSFWSLLAEQGIDPQMVQRDFSSTQKSVFFTALSLLFSFDLYLVPKTKFLMSRAGQPLRQLFLKRSQGAALVTTSANSRFLRQFCNRGLVLSPVGEPLFLGSLEEAMLQFDQAPGQGETEEADDALIQGLNLQNSDRETDDQDDIL
ncbi:MAG: hypothetical protein ACPHGV_07140 [Synechococcus sp.]